MDTEIALSLAKCLDCRQGKENIMEETQSQEAPERLDYAPPAVIINDQPEPGQILRTCRTCKKTKPKPEFYLNGAGKPDTVCKECRNRARKDKYKEERARKKTRLKAPSAIPLAPAQAPSKVSPLSRQVGGEHYKAFPMGKQDLEKIMHECELLMEMTA